MHCWTCDVISLFNNCEFTEMISCLLCTWILPSLATADNGREVMNNAGDDPLALLDALWVDDFEDASLPSSALF